ncbi:hypothetical protein RRG08_058422 [Elysia crispata]|uniref:Uncharacterized protein n=1 Tax=Elysia crispata TaxID=231223 RepID=A0AAE1AT22_9GAST|nr:hypothetical protein RRG08_058422 [Elysia crispata]
MDKGPQLLRQYRSVAHLSQRIYHAKGSSDEVLCGLLVDPLSTGGDAVEMQIMPVWFRFIQAFCVFVLVADLLAMIFTIL